LDIAAFTKSISPPLHGNACGKHGIIDVSSSSSIGGIFMRGWLAMTMETVSRRCLLAIIQPARSYT